MAAKKLLTAGNVFKRTDGRWNGVVWYLDEQRERKRMPFYGTSKQEVKDKITAYIAVFNRELEDSIKYWIILLIGTFLIKRVEIVLRYVIIGTAPCQIVEVQER